MQWYKSVNFGTLLFTEMCSGTNPSTLGPFSSYLLLSSLELSDTKVYEPSIRARLQEATIDEIIENSRKEMEHETASVAEEKQQERAAAAAPPAAEDEDSEASSLSSSNREELDKLVKGMADSGAPAAGGGSKSAKDNMRSIAQEWTVAGAGEAGKNRNIQSRTVKIDGHDVLRSHTHTLSLSRTHTHTLSHTHKISLSHTHTISLSLSHTISLCLSHTHSL